MLQTRFHPEVLQTCIAVSSLSNVLVCFLVFPKGSYHLHGYLPSFWKPVETRRSSDVQVLLYRAALL